MEPKIHHPAGSAVMDVARPATANPISATPKPEVDPLDQLVAEDQAEQAVAKKHAQTTAKPAPKKPKASPASSGVGLAITATVIIVLGLAALATYAYLKTAS